MLEGKSSQDILNSRHQLQLKMAVPKTDPILVIGAGAFGISTVFHLLKAGYSDITVLDKDDEVPSRFSAANDLNKIVRAEYEDPFYTDLTLVCEGEIIRLSND